MWSYWDIIIFLSETLRFWGDTTVPLWKPVSQLEPIRGGMMVVGCSIALGLHHCGLTWENCEDLSGWYGHSGWLRIIAGQNRTGWNRRRRQQWAGSDQGKWPCYGLSSGYSLNEDAMVWPKSVKSYWTSQNIWWGRRHDYGDYGVYGVVRNTSLFSIFKTIAAKYDTMI